MLRNKNIFIDESKKCAPSLKTLVESPTEKKRSVCCSVNQNLFDPSKSSPPNDFMIKLYMRDSKMNHYKCSGIKDDSRDSE